MISFKNICLILFIVLSVFEISAQDANGNPENWCRNGHFPQESEFKLATVTGKQKTKVHFLNDFDDCPQAGNAKCVEKSYVIPGDKLIVTRKYKNWVCGWYQPQRGNETVGWIPAENIVINQPETNPTPEKWLGTWKFYDQTLVIKKNSQNGFLKVSGEAYWRGLGDNIHIGEVNAVAKPEGNKLVLEEYSCRVTLRLIGDFLIARDNFNCGGVNVTFNGVYQKMKRKP